MKSNYKKLGPFIREVSVKNKNLEVEKLLGVSINKTFIPSIANTVGTDMSKYKIVRKNQFAYGPVTSRNGDRISIALLQEAECIVSTSYTVFEINNIKEIEPEYLMMWFFRKEFDRYARFKSHGSVREIFGWDELCKVEVPMPPIHKQRKIAEDYKALLAVIKLNETKNQKIEETAQAIYKNWFIDFEFPISAQYASHIGKPELEGKPYKSYGGEMVFCKDLDKNIPKGWRNISIKSFCQDMKNGATPRRDNPDFWNSPDLAWIKTGEISNNSIWHAEEYISDLGYQKSSTKILPKNTVLMAMIGATAAQIAYLKIKATTNQNCCAMVCKSSKEAAYLYYRLLDYQAEIKRLSVGGAQGSLNKAIIENFSILYSKENFPDLRPFSFLLETKSLNSKKIYLLNKSLSLLLSDLANPKFEED